jgi:hypothetical protein
MNPLDLQKVGLVNRNGIFYVEMNWNDLGYSQTEPKRNSRGESPDQLNYLITESMTLREKLLLNYQSELIYVEQMQDEGAMQVPAGTWDFTKTIETSKFIPIEQVISEIENRIEILSDPSCTPEQVEFLNY